MHIEKPAFSRLLGQAQPIILDGGLATQLEEQGCNLNTELWSADLLLNDPQAIINAHLAYLDTGAQIVTTASYQASIKGFISKGLSEDKAKQVIASSVVLAEQAIENYLLKNSVANKPLIAASVGPYGAYLADGSEYRGDYKISDQVLGDFHSQRLNTLDQTNADILACETIPSYQEAGVLAELLLTVKTPVWVSFSCCDGQHINDGTEIEKAVDLFKNHHMVLAVGVNCTAPNYISEIINRIKGAVDNKAIIVYPNSGEIYDANSRTWQSLTNPSDFAMAAKSWNQLGVQIIGGCCRVGPRQVQEIANTLKN